MILLNLSYKPNSGLFIAACAALYSLIEYDGTCESMHGRPILTNLMCDCAFRYLAANPVEEGSRYCSDGVSEGIHRGHGAL